eukprot:TRINITY_DN103417_c0_g1_i1.p1 TRINITY_DN103417_c0_g1~~TRINITY_DN103417_c0_g1_i1.p1  ORF type:complete len:134 (+),score=16.92 TRINITY_DN103417_c0_g1_i1:81-482(+)
MVLPFILPVGILGSIIGAELWRNRHDKSTDRHTAKARKEGVVERLEAGAFPPVEYFSSQHLERMLKTNSAMAGHEEDLRLARTGHLHANHVQNDPNASASKLEKPCLMRWMKSLKDKMPDPATPLWLIMIQEP